MNDRKLTRIDWSIIAALTAGVVLLYAQTLRFAFVNFDDDQYVFENPHVTSGLTWPNIAWAFTTGHASNWHPLTWMSHMLDAELFGPSAAGPHGTNFVLHAATAALLFMALRRLTGARWSSAIVAALFAFHPLRAESVAWVSERKDVLSGLFFVLTLICYERYARGRAIGRYALVALMLALGLLAKPMLVTLPCVLLLLDFWPLRRMRSVADFTSLFIEKTPLFVVCMGSAVATYIVQNAGRAVSRFDSMGPGPRLSNAGVSYISYLRDTFWPSGLAFFYPHPYSYPGGSIGLPLLLGSLTILLILTGVAVAAIRRAPWMAVGWFWYLGMLVPVIGIVQVGTQSHADRYTYLPVIGVTIALVFTIAAVVRDRPVGRTVAGVFAVGSLVVMSVMSFRQIGTWRDTQTLMRHALAVVPNNYAAHNNLGHELDQLGDSVGAEQEYRAVLHIKPDDAIAMNNLAVRLAARGEVREAQALYRAAIGRDPAYAPAYIQLGNLYAREGRRDDAINLYEQSIVRDPTLPEAYHNLGVSLAEGGSFVAAIDNWRKAIELKPDYADAHHAYGLALIVVGQTRTGIDEMKRAIELDAGRVDTRLRLAWTLATHPNAEFRDPAAALVLARQARELSPAPDATLLDTLAAAEAAHGEFSAASQTAAAAVAAAGDLPLAESIRARKKLYESGKPYTQGRRAAGGGAP